MGISVSCRAWLGAAIAVSAVLLSGSQAFAFDALQDGDIIVAHKPQLIASSRTLYRIAAAGGVPEAIVSDVGTVFAVADRTTIYSVENDYPPTTWKVWETNVVTGGATLLTQFSNTDYPLAVAMEPNGTLLVRGSNATLEPLSGALVRINLASGTHQTLVSGPEFGLSNGWFEGITLAVDSAGSIFVNQALPGGNTIGLTRIDPNTMAATDVFPSHPLLGFGGVLARDRGTNELLTTHNITMWGFLDPNDPQETVTVLPYPSGSGASYVSVEDTGDVIRVDIAQPYVVKRVDRVTGFTTTVHSFASGSHISDMEAVVLAPECDDGIDNDGDGYTDFGSDPHCTSADDDKEAPNPPGCMASVSPVSAINPIYLFLFALSLLWTGRRYLVSGILAD